MADEKREAIKGAVLAALEKGHTRRDAAALAGISHETFYAWGRDDLTFSDAVTQAEVRAVDFHMDCWRNGAKDDWRASMEFLARRRSEDYARKDVVTVLQRISKELDNLSDADLIALAAGDNGGDTAPDGAGEDAGTRALPTGSAP